MSYTDEQNFLFTEGMHLITGINGSGKTSMFIALYYALFGKPYKKTKVGSLINNTVNKDMLVTLMFSVDNDKYIIKRGQKPAIFEIYKNDELINQSATTSEYQNFLENDIIKVSEHVFKQLIFLGANVSTSKSFIDLTKAEKEELFQVITDTSIFSGLVDSIKFKVKGINQDLKDVQFRHKVLEEDLRTTKLNNIQLELQNVKILKHNTRLEEKRNELMLRIQEANNLIIKYNEAIQKIKEKKPRYDELTTLIGELNNRISQFDSEFKMLTSNLQRILDVETSFGVCIGCVNLKVISSVDVSEKEAIRVKIDYTKNQLSTLNMQKDDLLIEYQKLKDTFEKAKQIKPQRELQEDILNRSTKEIDELSRLETVNIDSSEVEGKETLVNTYVLDMQKQQTLLQNYAQLIKLFDNNNIKGLIIKQSLPILNKYVNFYLDNFSDFPFRFNIDEQFTTSIRNIYSVDAPIDYEFASLSNGQSMRVTFSLILAFLELVRFKNGVTTNLMILDEILDSSLDYIGRMELLQVIRSTFQDSAVFIISHNDDVVNNEIFTTSYTIQDKQIVKI
jgi:DNA repair exonuclease SbcCD ATPase subunit